MLRGPINLGSVSTSSVEMTAASVPEKRFAPATSGLLSSGTCASLMPGAISSRPLLAMYLLRFEGRAAASCVAPIASAVLARSDSGLSSSSCVGPVLGTVLQLEDGSYGSALLGQCIRSLLPTGIRCQLGQCARRPRDVGVHHATQRCAALMEKQLTCTVEPLGGLLAYRAVRELPCASHDIPPPARVPDHCDRLQGLDSRRLMLRVDPSDRAMAPGAKMRLTVDPPVTDRPAT